MSAVWFIIMLVLIFGIVAMLTSPWRGRAAGSPGEQTAEPLRLAATAVEDLEAARDGKYREIRDAELDRQTGHLSEVDFQTVDAGLRAEAVEILRRLDHAQTRLDKLQAAEVDRRVTTGIELDPEDALDLASEDELDLASEEDLHLEVDRETDAAPSRRQRD